MAPRVGFEPTTARLTAGCSTVELSRNSLRKANYTLIFFSRQGQPRLFQKVLQFLTPAGMAQFPQGFGLDLADPFSGHPKDLAHFFQSPGPAVFQTKTEPQDLLLPRGQGVQHFLQLFLEQPERSSFSRCRNIL